MFYHQHFNNHLTILGCLYQSVSGLDRQDAQLISEAARTVQRLDKAVDWMKVAVELSKGPQKEKNEKKLSGR